MATWAKEELVLPNGERVSAQTPVIVSASRSTDIPAFYADWFMERLKAGYVKWYNTCPHLCHYCYANANNAAALANWERHKACPHAETITGKRS